MTLKIAICCHLLPSVAIYCRISDDRDGMGLGVKRQEIDRRAFVEANGWDVEEIFIDNDHAAYSGKLRPRYLALMEQLEESQKTFARIRRRALDKAMKGEVWSTGSRPFGYKQGGMVIEEREAIALREVVQRFLAKEGINSLCRWLNDKEINTTAGRPFRAKALRDILINPRNCGQRS